MTTPNPLDVDTLVTCATNEGALYPMWCRMARAGSNTTDGDWCAALRPYVNHLILNWRYDGSANATTINTAAAAIRDYYLAHLQEA